MGAFNKRMKQLRRPLRSYGVQERRGREMKDFIIKILIVAGLYAISWALCVGFMYLICLCFQWEFDLLIATGIWLILCHIKLLFPSKNGGEEE